MKGNINYIEFAEKIGGSGQLHAIGPYVTILGSNCPKPKIGSHPGGTRWALVPRKHI